MSLFFYNLFLKLYRIGISLVAKKDNKAQRWLMGRTDIFEKMENALLHQKEKPVWIHCASLGEFEQGRPVIEALKNSGQKIVLTFFSPSGYEVRKNYPHADFIFYLPLDGKANAKRFIELVNPSVVLFVKYEFWYYYLETLHQKQIPTFLIAAKFRPAQPFFKWYGGLFRKMLSFYSHLFVQDEESKALLESIGIAGNITVAGDTRYDRVAAIAKQSQSYPAIEEWKGSDNIIIGGSTWQEDEKLLSDLFQQLPNNWKYIIAPHEIHETHLQEIENRFKGNVIRYSKLGQQNKKERILLIDNIGMLSSLYRYADIAFIGGGFGSGIHNSLEAAVFGIPVIFGPKYKKFGEAVDMVGKGFAFSVKDISELKTVFSNLSDSHRRTQLKKQLTNYMAQNCGATDTIMEELQRQF